ncbi:sigma-70 family RNA polymerase sigma factor [Nonomuraea dietziae]|uniref:sigma-70 family RNA polymerase sigma factor n=1 Tax=Nonomuraea dietziae TaxID=65515 RepID=UPI0031E009D9
MSVSDLYGELRPRAFAIAYQMLSSVSEAEDVVQEAFLRMHHTLQRGEPIASPRAYIATLTTRLAIDQLRSARVRREHYVGEWLPEPLVTGPTPAEHAERADSLSLAFLVLLENLSPHQRAALLLREVFDYPYTEVAEIIGTDVDSTRHLVARARNHVQKHRPRYHATRRQREELAQRFFAASEQGDLSALEELLAQDVALHVDGGGNVPALGQPVNGPGVRGRHRAGRPRRIRTPRRPHPSHRGQRPARRHGVRHAGPARRGHGTRHRRRWSDSDHPLHRQPRQAPAPRPGQRPRRPAARTTPIRRQPLTDGRARDVAGETNLPCHRLCTGPGDADPARHHQERRGALTATRANVVGPRAGASSPR